MGVVLELTKALSLLKNGEGAEESEA
jgi:hypothetical protein